MLLSNSWPVLERRALFFFTELIGVAPSRGKTAISVLTSIGFGLGPGYWRSESLLLELCGLLHPYLDSSIPKCPPRWPPGDFQHLMACVVHGRTRMYWSSWLIPMQSGYYSSRTVLRPRCQKAFQPCNNPHHRLEHLAAEGDFTMLGEVPRRLNGERWAPKNEFPAECSTQDDRTSKSNYSKHWKKSGQGYFSLVWICHPCETGLESLTCFSVLREAILCPVFP